MKRDRLLHLMLLLGTLCLGLLSFNCGTTSAPIIAGGDDDSAQADTDKQESAGDTENAGDQDSDGAAGDNDAMTETDTLAEATDTDTAPPKCKAGENNCCTEDKDCNAGTCYDGVCLALPTEEATVWWENSTYDENMTKTGEFDQFFDGTTPQKPDLSCVGGYQDVCKLAECPKVKVAGIFKVFGLKAPCTLLKASVYPMYDDQGNALTTFDDSKKITTDGVVKVDAKVDCPVEIDDVPTGRWLVIKSSSGDNNFRDTYVYNMYIKPGEASPFAMEINSISDPSWNLIPVTAGLANGVQSDRGAIAGTVKDCKGQLIKNAVVSLTVSPSVLAYFNANVENLLPSQGLETTNEDGTFAAVNQPAMSVRLVGVAKVNGAIVKLNDFTINMLPGTVSILAFHGAGPATYGIFVPPTK
jgi:hypothetical protein